MNLTFNNMCYYLSTILYKFAVIVYIPHLFVIRLFTRLAYLFTLLLGIFTFSVQRALYTRHKTCHSNGIEVHSNSVSHSLPESRKVVQSSRGCRRNFCSTPRSQPYLGDEKCKQMRESGRE